MNEDIIGTVKVGLTVLAVCVVTAVTVLAPSIVKDADVRYNWMKTEGVVTECTLVYERRFNGKVWYTTEVMELQYEYNVGDSIYTGVMKSSDSISEGASVTVRYDPEQPWSSRGFR